MVRRESISVFSVYPHMKLSSIALAIGPRKDQGRIRLSDITQVSENISYKWSLLFDIIAFAERPQPVFYH